MSSESRFTSDRRPPGEATSWKGSNDWRAGEAIGVDIIDQKLKRRNQRNAVLHEDIIARYQCDHSFNKGTLTDSVGSYHGNINGPSYIAEAKWGSLALEFGKSLGYDETDYINLPDLPSQFISEGAVSVWLRTDSTITQYPIWLGAESGGKARSLVLDGSKIGFVGWGENQYVGGVVQTGEWIHVVYTWKAPSEAMVYVNGEFGGGTDSLSLENGGQSNAIGHRSRGAKNYYRGIVDDLRLYNSMLGHQDAETIYNSY